MSNQPLHVPRSWPRVVPRLLMLSSLAIAALGCGDGNDDTVLQHDAGSGGTAGGAGGSAGTGGNAGHGGNPIESHDAGPDGSSPEESCVVGTLQRYCDVINDCTSLSEARRTLREASPLEAQAIVQRPCTAPDGSPRISVSANYLSRSKTLIYDAATEQLVSVEIIDDLGLCSGVTLLGGSDASDGFGEVSGYYGEASPDCSSGFPDFFIPATCDSLDAGALDAGQDAGPYECVVTL